MDAPRDIGLTLVLGPANSGKMGRVLGWWSERLPHRPVVVVPTVPDARELTREMARRSGGQLGQSPAVTFDGLVGLLLGKPPRRVGDLARLLLVSRLLQDTPLEDICSVAHLPGVTTALGLLIQQLGDSGRGPDELDRILARWSSDREAASLARDIRRVVASYERECGLRGLVERSTAARQATVAAAGWTRPVAFYGFTSFTLGQRALVERLSQGVETLVTFSHDPARTINLSTPDEISWWRALAARTLAVSTKTRAYESPSIAFLERYFLSDEAPPEAPPARAGASGVRFLLASGRRAEAELAAQQIAGLLQEGVSPGDIAVIVRRVHSWSGLLGHVFESCGIPHRIDDRRLLWETGMGHAFLRALEGVLLDDADGVLAYLRSPYSGISPEEVSDLDLRYRRGTALGARVLAQIADDMSLRSLGSLWTMVVADGTGGSRLDHEAARAVIGAMLAAGIGGAAAGSEETEEDARAFRALDSALATVASLAPDERCEWLDARLALRALAQATVPGAGEEGDAVQVLSVQRARARRFDTVVILGLVEGEFPGPSEDLSLLDKAQRARLDALGGGLFTPDTDEEAALFVSAVSRASRALYLSARDAEDDGGEATPSYFWHSARDLLGVAGGECLTRTLSDQVFTPESAPSLRHYLRACAAVGAVSHSGTAGTVEVAPRPWSPPPGRLEAPEIVAELAAQECFSPSALEAYARCPFSWFIERIIGVAEVESELDDQRVGRLLHDALSAAYAELASTGLLPLRPECVPAAEGIVSRLIDRLVDGPDCPGTVAERRLAGRRLMTMAQNLFAMEASAAAGLVLHSTEMWVGGPGGVDIGGLRLRGRIDRVDMNPESKELFIYDYKTGSIPASAALGTAEGLQLPLYLLALAAERQDVEVVGGAYLGLSAKKRVGVVAAGAEGVLGKSLQGYRVLDEAGMEEVLQATRELAMRAAAGMRAGIIAPRDDRDCPPWCELGPVCRSHTGGYRP